MAIDFAQDGSVIIEWTGAKADLHTVTVPSPMIGDYRKLRNRLDELARIEDDLREKWTKATGKDKTKHEQAVRDHMENWVINWLTTPLDGDGRTLLGVDVDPDTWPSWLAARAVPAGMLTHWRTLPLASGAPKTDALP
jgi:hypothetical protein